MMKKMKNNNINKTGLIIGAFCLIMVSCKAPSLTPTEKIELPKFYMDRETDSTTISSLSWKTFFPDTLLQSYIAEALNNNHSFLQTIERISIARSQVRVGKGALLPDLSLGIDGGVQRFGEYTMDGVGNSTTNTPDLEKDKHIPDPYRNFNLGLNFQWEADIWGKLTDKKRSTVSGIESIHQFGELPLTQGQGSGRHNHPLGNMMRVGRHVTTVARHFQGRLHADDRNIVVFAQIVHRGGSGGVACDDHGLDALTHEPFDNIETQGPHLFRRLDAVRCVGRITKIQHMLGRHILGDLASHGNTAKTRIEYADWSRRAHA